MSLFFDSFWRAVAYCLRITDLPQVAGLLYPTELVFTGDLPATYEWATKLYRDLGPPAQLHHVCDLSSWQTG